MLTSADWNSLLSPIGPGYLSLASPNRLAGMSSFPGGPSAASGTSENTFSARVPPKSPKPNASTSFANLESATAQARSLGESVLSSLNDSMQTSTTSQASPLLSLLYSPHVHFTISTVCKTLTEERTLHDVNTLADTVGALADVGLLGAKFDKPAHCKCEYTPARISVAVAGAVQLSTEATVRYWRQLVLLWGTNGISSPRTISPADWRICEDNIMLFT